MKRNAASSWLAVQAAAVDTHAQLIAEAQKLAQLSQQKADQQAIDRQTELLAELSKAAGTNVVKQDINDGSFRGYTLSVSGSTLPLCIAAD